VFLAFFFSKVNCHSVYLKVPIHVLTPLTPITRMKPRSSTNRIFQIKTAAPKFRGVGRWINGICILKYNI